MSLADDIMRKVQAGAIDGLEDAARAVLAKAQANIPVSDPADDPDPNVSLRRAGRITPDGKGYIISFETPYAAKVHEDLRARHPRGGQAKYLKRAVDEITPTLDRIIASKVSARTAKGL